MESGEINLDSLVDILFLDCWPRQPKWIEFMCLVSRAMIRAFAERTFFDAISLFGLHGQRPSIFLCLPRPPQGLPWHPGFQRH
ncbi:hypothetical protein CIPAW_11G098200 [Carya illinoinensis]|uniref:Uncharacterized protein n=1 Tax=Carya illinoinensis TaxID=32201 RepID=A0A8T1P1X3_CARIL|nr:hypothetical protein CIPAW_11G098200 [Carya illinoinensis]